MTRRVLVVEPDPSGRMVVQRALSNAGHSVVTAATLSEARALLDAGQIRLAIVDEAAGSGQALEEAQRLRALYPRVPVVVTGSLLSQRLLLALMQLGMVGALLKPFSPEELVETTEAALCRSEGDDGVEYAAALTLALHAIGRGRLPEARSALGRARAVAPLDTSMLALAVLIEELSGHDALASRGYRALLALTQGDEREGHDARAGLARLDAYGNARPVAQLTDPFQAAPVQVVDDGSINTHATSGPLVIAAGLGLGGDAIYWRQGPGPVAFALYAGQPPTAPDLLSAEADGQAPG